MHRVVGVCFDGVVAFDLAAPAQVFGSALGPAGEPLYEFVSCSPGGREVATTTGFGLSPRAGLEAVGEAETVVVPGYLEFFSPPPAPVLEALKAAAARGARIVSVCSGAFALAHAGLLDGRRATTHWRWADDLAARFPLVRVDPAVLWIDEGAVLTSAGLSAGIDLSLHIVRADWGAAVGDRVARHMVAAPHRDGGQAQFVRPLGVAGGGTTESTRRWLEGQLEKPVDVIAMARHAGVSPRTFARRFREETGTTPHRWLLERRVLAARRMLEESRLPIEEVAERAGFGDAASLRIHFRRALATTPTAYRRAFGA